jgi:hypothetical protein
MRWYMLPMWFGQERSLLEYVHGTSYLPTFVSTEANAINGFVTVQQHFPRPLRSFASRCMLRPRAKA